jgi:hypothetical protein
MKNNLPLIIIIAAIVLGTAWFFIVRNTFFAENEKIDEPYNTLPEQPSVEDDATKISLSNSVGGSTVVSNFLATDEAVPDQNNAGYYSLGYTFASDTVPYVIQYIEETDQFTITLMQEPLGETRRQAEMYLQSVLGIDEQRLCDLKYTVSVPWIVNEYFAGYSFGFSFCEGAIEL